MKLECSTKLLRNVWLTFHSIKRKVSKWNKNGLISVTHSVLRIVLTAPIYSFFYCLYVAYNLPNQVKRIISICSNEEKCDLNFSLSHYILSHFISIVLAWHVYPLRGKQLCTISVRSNRQTSTISNNMDDSDSHSRSNKVVLLFRACKILRRLFI